MSAEKTFFPVAGSVLCTRGPLPGFGYCYSHDDCREKRRVQRERAVLDDLLRGVPVPPKSRRRPCCSPVAESVRGEQQ